MTTYVLGAGAIGTLVAHELALNARATQTALPKLLLKSKSRLDAYKEQDSKTTVLRTSKEGTTKTQCIIDAISLPPVNENGSPVPITQMIVATKAYATKRALAPYVPQMGIHTDLVILQNGMGMAASLMNAFWPDVNKAPRIFQAVTTHGAYKATLTEIHHVGLGSMHIAEFPSSVGSDGTVHYRGPSNNHIDNEMDHKMTDSPLVNSIIQCENLQAKCLPYNQFLLRQMEKFVVNVCVNPLTALLDCLNGDLLYGTMTTQIMERVIKETVACFWAEYPELVKIPEAYTALERKRLLSLVLDVCKLTAQNSSSMREDVRSLSQTEIESLNGYVVRLGYKHRIGTQTNRILQTMVRDKMQIEQEKERALMRDVFLRFPASEIFMDKEMR